MFIKKQLNRPCLLLVNSLWAFRLGCRAALPALGPGPGSLRLRSLGGGRSKEPFGVEGALGTTLELTRNPGHAGPGTPFQKEPEVAPEGGPWLPASPPLLSVPWTDQCWADAAVSAAATLRGQNPSRGQTLKLCFACQKGVNDKDCQSSCLSPLKAPVSHQGQA